MFPTLVVLISLTVLTFSLYDKSPVAAAVSFVKRTSATPPVAELLRFIFLGTIVGAGRQLGDMIVKLGLSLFVVEAEFSTNDFAYDWVLSYLENNRVWKESRFFKVVARISVPRVPQAPSPSKVDGHPDALYEPASLTPSVFQWQGYWISVKKTVTGQSHFTTGQEMGGTLTIRIWSRNRQALDDFVQAARKFYIDSDVPPRKLDRENDRSGGLVTALFHQGDLSYDWMLAFLRSVKVLQDFQDYSISTKQSDLDWGNGPQDLVRYLPAYDTKQQLLFTSPRTGKKTWLQFVVAPGHHNRSSSVETGGSITLILHSCDRSTLADLIDTAHKIYVEHGVSNVSVRLTDNKGRWAKTLTKNRRAFSSLILPEGIKETLVSDAKQFLESEKWYNEVGVPHRRGYLLYGEPGTGKSTTIHVLAGELGLDIYFISLASPGIDDYSLAKLINDTPSPCILLLEDIDCAFPSRDDTYGEDEDEDPVFDKDGQPVTRSAPPKSAVTLSGLLNVLDSVSSGEGRLTFGTTNHIENLDSALIRAGRFDVKIQYKLAERLQIEQVFKRFYPVGFDGGAAFSVATYTQITVEECALKFAQTIPARMYSIAQIQGHLLTKKMDPVGALEGVDAWLEAQEEEKRMINELKDKRKAERAEKLMLRRGKVAVAVALTDKAGEGS